MKRFARLFPAITSRLVCYLLCVALIFSQVPVTASSSFFNAATPAVQGSRTIAGTNVKPATGRVKSSKQMKAEDPVESTSCSRRDKECRQRKERKGNRDEKKDEKKIGSNLPTITSTAAPLYANLRAWQPPVFAWDKTPASWLEPKPTDFSNSSYDAISDSPTFAAHPIAASATVGTLQCTYCLTVPAPTNIPGGGTVWVNWSAPSNHSSSDWIGLYRVGATNYEYLDFQYVPAGASGTIYFWAPYDEGTYQLRYLQHDPNDFNVYLTMGTSNNFTVFSLNFPAERIDPVNRVGTGGEDLLSRNFNWNTSLVNLPGRSGLDLNVSLNYNSLVWTKSATQPYIGFDNDIGSPSPGFNLGTPYIQGPFNRPVEGAMTYYYILILPSGRRVELRNELPGLVNPSKVFLSTDGSHLRLRISTSYGHMMLMSPDGTRMFFYPHTRGYECERITDRNGNYIKIGYLANGNLGSMTDTLGRKINFIYDSYNHLIKITQDWNNNTNAADDHVWATFTWSNILVTPNFTGLTPSGLGGTTIPMITQVSTDDGAIYRFTYTRWGQVRQIENIASLTILSTRAYNLPPSSSTAQTDCPRFTQRTDSSTVYYSVLNNYTYVPVASSTECTGCVMGQLVMPDGTTVCETYAMNTWQRGLMVKSAIKETSTATTEKKKTFYTWTQDSPGAQNQFNPRLIETNVYDDATNRKRTETVYKAGTGSVPWYVKLPDMIKEYSANASTVYRMTQLKYLHETLASEASAGTAQYVKLNGNAGFIDYNIDLSTDRWLVGLATEECLYEGGVVNTANLKSKVKRYYDDLSVNGITLLTHQIAVNHSVAMHGATYATTSFRWRGNLTRAERWDATAPTDVSKTALSIIGYNTAGLPLLYRDPVGAQTDVSYQDNFSDSAYNGNSTAGFKLAYPTKVTDPDGRVATTQFFSTAKFDYNFGAVMQSAAPKRAQDAAATAQTYTYDSARRVTRVESSVDPTNLYTRYEYSPDLDAFSVFSKVDTGLAETYTHTYLDGFGKVAGVEKDHPLLSGVQRSSYTEFVFDNMGRVFKQSNPTEVDSFTLAPAGDDASTGFIYSQQLYNWQGKPTISTNQDGTTQQISYNGCGCAGSDTITATDEMGRKVKSFNDVFGRTFKTQTLKLDNTVYATTATSYDVRNLASNVTEYAGDVGSATSQQTVMTYDGHGRLKTRQRPEESAATTYDYYANDQVKYSKDARNAEGTLTYNLRGLLTNATYVSPGSVATTNPVGFQYDERGSRTEMDDSPGKVTYQYNSLGRLTSETRTFDAISGQAFTLAYQHNLVGQVKTLTDSFSGVITYGRDKAGRTVSITGTPVGGVTNYATGIEYRAWGGAKTTVYGSGFTASATFTARMQTASFDMYGVSGSTMNNVMGGTYTYNNAGQLTNFVAQVTRTLPNNQTQVVDFDRRMDRTVSYDEFGRLTSSAANNIFGFYANYAQTQDQFGNVTNSTYRHWTSSSVPAIFTAQYANNKVVANTASDQDKSQNNLPQTWEYDAMGNRTRLANTAGNVTVEQLAFDGAGRAIPSGVQVDGTGQPASDGASGYVIRSTVFGGQIVTYINSQGQKYKGRVLNGSSLIAEQIGGAIKWHHRDPLNQMSRDTEANQVKGTMVAITPLGVQMPSTEGVNLSTYYACLYAPGSPNCGGQIPQPPGGYGPDKDKEHGQLAGSLKVDGVLTLWGLNDLQRRRERTGNKGEVITYGGALGDTPLIPGISVGGGGGIQRRQSLPDIFSWNDKNQSVTTGQEDEIVLLPGNNNGESAGGQQGGGPPPKDPLLDAVETAWNILKANTDCFNLIAGSMGKEPADLLGWMYQNNRVNRGTPSPSDAVAGVDGRGTDAKMTIGPKFFTGAPTLVYSGNDIRSLTVKGGQVYTILHELSHATGKMTHTWLKKVFYDEYHPGSGDSTQSSFDIDIVDKCFKDTKGFLAPEPKRWPKKG